MKAINRSLLFIILLIPVLPALGQGSLKISPDGRSIQKKNGEPFFWLGDTAWMLFGKLNLDEIKMYLDNRAAKGFNVIQAVCLFQSVDRHPNRYGDYSLKDKENIIPNERYFALIDSTIQYAKSKNMYMALVASWGDYVDSGLIDSAKAASYGQWLGKHFKKYDNIIWIMGGDRQPVSNDFDYRPVWRALANGIIETAGHKWLITFHPNGERSSSEWFHQELWLDFNMIQSSHGRRDAPVWQFVKTDLEFQPAKPTLDGEPNYEDHPANPWPAWKVENGYFRDYDVRKQLYRSVFSGACGVTYGHHAIWQIFRAEDEGILFVDRGWINALDRPGAFQAGYLHHLMDSRPTQNRMPCSELITKGQGESAARMEATRDKDGRFILVYLPLSIEFELDLSEMPSTQLKAWWFDPKNNKAFEIGTLMKQAKLTFTPPESPDHQDWVLVLDDAAASFKKPGK